MNKSGTSWDGIGERIDTIFLVIRVWLFHIHLLFVAHNRYLYSRLDLQRCGLSPDYSSIDSSRFSTDNTAP